MSETETAIKKPAKSRLTSTAQNQIQHAIYRQFGLDNWGNTRSSMSWDERQRHEAALKAARATAENTVYKKLKLDNMNERLARLAKQHNDLMAKRNEIAKQKGFDLEVQKEVTKLVPLAQVDDSAAKAKAQEFVTKVWLAKDADELKTIYHEAVAASGQAAEQP